MTASRPDIALPIDVRGRVRLDAPSGRRATLTAKGSTLCLEVPGWEDLAHFGPPSLLRKRRSLAAVLRSLDTLSLQLQIVVAGSRMFALGRAVGTSWPARLLGLSSTDIDLRAIFQLARVRDRARSRHSSV